MGNFLPLYSVFKGLKPLFIRPCYELLSFRRALQPTRVWCLDGMPKAMPHLRSSSGLIPSNFFILSCLT
jgi:hypothetical protein